MAQLKGEARTILRSRIRRHPDTHKHIDPKTVGGMSAADLVQIGALLALDVPTEREVAGLATLKEKGTTGRAALRALDEATHKNGLGGAGLVALVNGWATGADMDATDDDQDDDTATDVDTDEATTDAPAAMDVDATADTDADPAKIEAEAAALCADIQAHMGRGDFQGYTDRMKALAIKALTPPPAPVIPTLTFAPIDVSKIKGHVPLVIGAKTMKQAGVVAMDVCRDAATALPVFDYPGAPAIDPAYVWPDLSGAVFVALAKGRNVFLHGPAGTGKTEFARQVAARWGRPFVRISCDDQTEAATLTGMTVPEVGGGTRWQDGQLAAAIRKPGTVILIDEPSVARPGALFVLQALLDTDRAMHLAETGDVIPAAPGVLFILADNTNGTGDTSGAYEATRRLNRAFLDRAAVTLEVGYLGPIEEARALVARTGIDKPRAAALAKFAALTRAETHNGRLSHGLGLRRLIALSELLLGGVQASVAFQVTVIETAPYDDKEPLRQLWAAEIGATL